ncbi:toxin-antitoxin system YwqK family antitoxin [Acinetobacter sp. ANC 5054]|uniref:toxin-antitoxin system YwqK family antitoxin n=1 Tax=Acinetobacter sp. ANC 5054 TaxID=1977877 RepID=UPI00148A54C7|nr:toxin-antitoxin system YwqK family antitoxin [Acinetobacter sp. ANC 5054]
MKKLILGSCLLLCSIYSFADGYLNEYMVVFVSEEDPDLSPWKNKPQCIALSTPSKQKGVFENQYTYANGNALTTIFLSPHKIKNGECENLVHFPDDLIGSGVFESYYPNGKPRSRIEYRDGSYQGKLQFWFPNGLKQQENTIIDGESEGDYKIWHPNGQIALSMKYKNGVENGLRQRWYKDGKPWTSAVFQNNKLISDLKMWFENGKLERHGYYRDGVRHNSYKIWYDDGKPEAVLQYNLGKITSAKCWKETGESFTGQSCAKRYQDED